MKQSASVGGSKADERKRTKAQDGSFVQAFRTHLPTPDQRANDARSGTPVAIRYGSLEDECVCRRCSAKFIRRRCGESDLRSIARARSRLRERIHAGSTKLACRARLLRQDTALERVGDDAVRDAAALYRGERYDLSHTARKLVILIPHLRIRNALYGVCT